MNTWHKILLSIFIIFIISLFLRGCYLDKNTLRTSSTGFVIDKRTGSKGSHLILIKNLVNDSITKFDFPPYDNALFFDRININDSIYKYSGSYFVSFYRKFDSGFELVDSFEVYHY